MKERTYVFNGYSPYGAGQQLFIDGFLDDDFSGNATEQLINEGRATFEIVDNKTAVLIIDVNNGNYEKVDYVRR